MSRFVVDCSVVMSWCFEDEADRYADSVLEALAEQEAVVPSLLHLEVANVLLGAERRRRLAEADTSQFLDILAALPVAVEETGPALATGPVLAVGRRFRLSAYDSAYLELAMRKGLPLATRDRRLRAACRKAGVALFPAASET